MAVRHGYGKIAGTDALVFAYDTGDTRNSYKGEPTENIRASSGLDGSYSDTGRTIDNSGTLTAPDGTTGWSSISSPGSNSNYRIAKFTYNSLTANTTYTFSLELYNPGPNALEIFVDGNAGYAGTTIPLGYSKWTYTITRTSSGNQAIFFGAENKTTNATYSPERLIYFKNYQVEQKSHATPFVSGTRSVSGSLLDLTSNSSIDLSNVSFDNNAQKTFDGTDDGVNLGTAMLNLQNASFSLEAMINWDGGSTDTFFGYTYANGQRQNIHWRIYDTGQLRFDFYSDSINSGVGAIVADEWIHLLVTYDYSTDTCICYKNGNVLMQGTSGPFTGDDNASTAYLGYWGNSGQYYGGDLPIFKAYNRALTAHEVRNNYRHYKKRFNI